VEATRFVAVINAYAGTVARLSPTKVVRKLSVIWKAAGHQAEVILAGGKGMGNHV